MPPLKEGMEARPDVQQPDLQKSALSPSAETVGHLPLNLQSGVTPEQIIAAQPAGEAVRLEKDFSTGDEERAVSKPLKKKARGQLSRKAKAVLLTVALGTAGAGCDGIVGPVGGVVPEGFQRTLSVQQTGRIVYYGGEDEGRLARQKPVVPIKEPTKTPTTRPTEKPKPPTEKPKTPTPRPTETRRPIEVPPTDLTKFFYTRKNLPKGAVVISDLTYDELGKLAIRQDLAFFQCPMHAIIENLKEKVDKKGNVVKPKEYLSGIQFDLKQPGGNYCVSYVGTMESWAQGLPMDFPGRTKEEQASLLEQGLLLSEAFSNAFKQWGEGDPIMPLKYFILISPRDGISYKLYAKVIPFDHTDPTLLTIPLPTPAPTPTAK